MIEIYEPVVHAIDKQPAVAKIRRKKCSYMKGCTVPKKFAVIGLLALTYWICPASAQQVDPHTLYEQNCAGCHTLHAGEFVYENLDLIDNTLVGKKTGRPVSAFLETGHGGLSPDEIKIMMDHLSSIRQSGRLFHEKCRICHVNAKELARLNLIIRDGILLGRYTGKDIAQFLLNHGRLDTKEAARMVDVLKRQLMTTPTTQN